MNIEEKKLLLVGFLEHHKTQLLKSCGKIGLDLIMEDLETRVKQFRKEFQNE